MMRQQHDREVEEETQEVKEEFENAQRELEEKEESDTNEQMFYLEEEFVEKIETQKDETKQQIQ